MAGLLDRYDSAADGWTSREASHLLRRCAAGATSAEIGEAVAGGLETTVDRLTTEQPESEEFVSTASLLHRSALKSGSIGGLKNWWLYRFIHSANPLTEKMTLFWHNHFATSNAKVRSVEKMNAQHSILRDHALGNFGDLFRAMARDVAMLVWLDGNANRKRHPNENFAREVMELFSLGVGNYTESDIREAARAFTGWHVRKEQFWFNSLQHDPGVKKVLGESGPFKGDDILELCLRQEACPRFLATKLLQTFVRPRPSESLIDKLAARITFHRFALTPVLRELLSSRAFFAPASVASLIKSPLELVAGSHRSLGGRANLGECVQLMSDLGQNLFEPPTVKGWEGGRLWINSATLLQRGNFAARLCAGETFGKIGEEVLRQGKTSGAVDEFLGLLLAGEVSKGARRKVASYHRTAKGSAVDKKRGLIQLIMTMPEYQMI